MSRTIWEPVAAALIIVVVIALGVLVLRRREALASGDARVGRAKRRAATQPTPATALVALAGLLTLLVFFPGLLLAVAHQRSAF